MKLFNIRQYRVSFLLIILQTCFLVSIIFASPRHWITHNETNRPVNFFVDDVAGPQPTPPYQTTKIGWFIVEYGCRDHVKNTCPIDVIMDFDKLSPIKLGILYLDLGSGKITPSILSAHGYQLNVRSPGEVIIS